MTETNEPREGRDERLLSAEDLQGFHEDLSVSIFTNEDIALLLDHIDALTEQLAAAEGRAVLGTIWRARVRAALHELNTCRHDGWCHHRYEARHILAGERDADILPSLTPPAAPAPEEAHSLRARPTGWSSVWHDRHVQRAEGEEKA
jgi:hypothetical protein